MTIMHDFDHRIVIQIISYLTDFREFVVVAVEIWDILRENEIHRQFLLSCNSYRCAGALVLLDVCIDQFQHQGGVSLFAVW